MSRRPLHQWYRSPMTPDEFDRALIGKISLKHWQHKSIHGVRPCDVVECGNGWLGLIHDALIDMLAMGWDGVVSQIKEKFGTLRIYLDDLCQDCGGKGRIEGIGNREIKCHGCDGVNRDLLERRITEAEGLSEVTCEVCGAAATKRVHQGWHSTMCKKCIKEEEDFNRM